MIDFKELKTKRTLNSKNIYQDKKITGTGIDYNTYFKLWFESVNELHIKDFYTIEGWYLLWYLMCETDNNNLTKTTINIIASEIQLTSSNVKDMLLYLNHNEIIKLNKTDNISLNTPLEIYVLYNDKYYEQVVNNHQNGYKAIPKEFIKTILPTISPKEFAILSVLFTRYNYYIIDQNLVNGYISYKFKNCQYAFPTIRNIEELTGISHTTALRELKKLENNKYNLIKVDNPNITIGKYDESGNFKVKQSNNIYKIPLFERIEYNYCHYINTPEQRNIETINEINSKGFLNIAETENYKILNIKDYLIFYYNYYIEQYKECINLINTNNKELAKEKYSNLMKYLKQ